MTVYDETVREYAEHFSIPEGDMRDMFGRYLSRQPEQDLDPTERALCYGLYRTVKLKSAFRSTSKSRERWRERAMGLGSPGHLVDGDPQLARERTLRKIAEERVADLEVQNERVRRALGDHERDRQLLEVISRKLDSLKCAPADPRDDYH